MKKEQPKENKEIRDKRGLELFMVEEKLKIRNMNKPEPNPMEEKLNSDITNIAIGIGKIIFWCLVIVVIITAIAWINGADSQWDLRENGLCKTEYTWFSFETEQKCVEYNLTN